MKTKQTKCDCQSLNKPDWGGSTMQIQLDPNSHFPEVTTPAKLVGVDKCIANEVIALWRAGIWTKGSCCGHNGKVKRSIIIENWQDAEKAKRLVGKKTELLAWKLITL